MLRRFGHWLLVGLLKWSIEFIYATCRVRYLEGEDVRDDLLRNRRPVIFLFWHNRIFMATGYLRKVFFNKGVHLTVLISKSDDGATIANAVKRWGGDVARGSTSRGGKEALTAISHALKRKSSVVITPDGPRGPLYTFQSGAIVAAQLTQTELVPLCLAPRRFWRLNSWDGFLIPKPFTELWVSLGRPEREPRHLTEEQREERRRYHEQKMRQQQQRIDHIAGVPEYTGRRPKKKD
ncbi:MAG: lysophospholipid acyltransferase family protein [Turneriella sp.]|nr:lysophospholipid acyltransferase family protein [Turneriella sp.]